MTTAKPVLIGATLRAFESLVSTLELSAKHADKLAGSFAIAERDGLPAVKLIRGIELGYLTEKLAYSLRNKGPKSSPFTPKGAAGVYAKRDGVPLRTLANEKRNQLARQLLQMQVDYVVYAERIGVPK